MFFSKKGFSRDFAQNPTIINIFKSIVMLLFIIGLLYFLFFWKPWQPVDRKALLEAEPVAVLTPEEKYKQYKFYELLPKQQVTPLPDQPYVVETNTSNVSEFDDEENQNIQYILQIKSFQDPAKADEQRSLVLLTNTKAEIVEIKENDRTWYRVISGPYSTLAEAERIKQKLHNSNIDSILSQVSENK